MFQDRDSVCNFILFFLSRKHLSPKSARHSLALNSLTMNDFNGGQKCCRYLGSVVRQYDNGRFFSKTPSLSVVLFAEKTRFSSPQYLPQMMYNEFRH